MHSVDATTESMIRPVLAYAENRLRLNPVPLDRGSRDPAELEAALKGLALVRFDSLSGVSTCFDYMF